MTCMVKHTHSNSSSAHKNFAQLREGELIYQHQDGRFVVLEFQGESGKFRESFWPEEVIKVPEL